MATAIPNANINIPYSSFLDVTTGRPSQEWLLWLMNPNVVTFTSSNIIIKGGTIDNVAINNSTIGLTTPAAGKFTDFTALNGVKGGTF
jgi:hypothetical protein